MNLKRLLNIKTTSKMFPKKWSKQNHSLLPKSHWLKTLEKGALIFQNFKVFLNVNWFWHFSSLIMSTDLMNRKHFQDGLAEKRIQGFQRRGEVSNDWITISNLLSFWSPSLWTMIRCVISNVFLIICMLMTNNINIISPSGLKKTRTVRTDTSAHGTMKLVT